MENVVRNSFAGRIGSGKTTSVNNNIKVSANSSVISKIYEREAEEYCRLNELAVREPLIKTTLKPQRIQRFVNS